jgi:hypothetical protein
MHLSLNISFALYANNRLFFVCRKSCHMGGPTAGVTGKRGMWRTKPPDAESASWGR